MSRKFLAIAILTLFFVGLPNSVLAEEKAHPHFSKPPLITITGNANLSVAPDKATVEFAITNENKVFNLAREKNEEVAAQILNILRKLQFNDKKITLQNLNVYEQNEYDSKQNKNIFVGYKAQRSFKVVIDQADLSKDQTLSDRVAQLVTAVSNNGANSLNGVYYSLSNPQKFVDAVLAQAVLNAKAKAELMLNPLGSKLGPVVEVVEGTPPRPSPLYKSLERHQAMLMADSSAVPNAEAYSEGDIELSATVTASFEILR